MIYIFGKLNFQEKFFWVLLFLLSFFPTSETPNYDYDDVIVFWCCSKGVHIFSLKESTFELQHQKETSNNNYIVFQMYFVIH